MAKKTDTTTLEPPPARTLTATDVLGQMRQQKLDDERGEAERKQNLQDWYRRYVIDLALNVAEPNSAATLREILTELGWNEARLQRDLEKIQTIIRNWPHVLAPEQVAQRIQDSVNEREKLRIMLEETQKRFRVAMSERAYITRSHDDAIREVRRALEFLEDESVGFDRAELIEKLGLNAAWLVRGG